VYLPEDPPGEEVARGPQRHGRSKLKASCLCMNSTGGYLRSHPLSYADGKVSEFVRDHMYSARPGPIVDSRAQLEEHNPWAWKVLIGCVLNLLRLMLTYVLLEMMRAREAERGFGQGGIGREVWGWWGREVIWGFQGLL